MKKLFILMFCMILLVGTISAMEWDNKVSYLNGENGNSDLKAKFQDTFAKLFPLGEIGTAELKSHSDVNYIKEVGVGKQVTMFYDFNFSKLYKNGLGEVIFTDKRTGEVVERDYKYVYWVEEEYEQDIYGETFFENGTATHGKIGTETRTKGRWLPYDTLDIPKGKIRIGIEVNNKQGDFMDGVWEIVGEKVNKHASWQSSLETQILAWYGLNETAGSTANDLTGNFSGTYEGNLPNPFDGINPPVTNNSQFFNGTSDIDVTGLTGTGNHYSFSFWSNATNGAGNDYMFDSSAGRLLITFGNTDTGSDIGFYDGTWRDFNVPAPTDGEFRHYVILLDQSNSNALLYINGTNVANVTYGSTTFSGNIRIGSNNAGTAEFIRGKLDEFAIYQRLITFVEITILYNDNGGCTWKNCESAINPPSVTLNSPVVGANLTSSSVEFNGTVTSLIGITNVSLFLDGILNVTNSSGVNDTNYLFTKIIDDGDHNWTYQSCNTDGCTTETTRDFVVDTTFPQIDISDPVDLTSYIYQIYNDSFNLNVTVIDTNLDTCYYEYNLTNTSYSCLTGVQKNETFAITNQSNIRVWANDTSGNLNSSSVSWNIGLFDFNNYTSDSNISELSPTTFIGNFQTNTSITSAYLEYNNTNYSASIDSLGGNIYILSRTVTSPTVSTDVNVSWNFWANNINATQFNQTIFNIQLDDCSSYSNVIAYYYLRDELDQTLINNSNSTIESLINLRTLDRGSIAQFNQVFEGNSTPIICSELDLTSSNLRIWEQSRYGSDDYVFEQHNIQNASMTTFANFTLLDLPSTSATTFRIVYKSETFLPVTDAVINIQRKYIGEGVFKSIESPITDANGETSASLDLNAVIYRILVRKNGVTLSTFENPAVVCQNILTGDCTINLNEKQTINFINNFDLINDFNYGLTQDNRTITLTFEIPSGTSRSINLFVNQSTILGNKTSCNQTTFATSGQIQCVIDPTLGDVFASVEVSSDGTLITTASTTILEDRSQYFGTDNIVLTFFLVLSLILLMVSDPITVLMGILIGLIAGGLMLFLNMGSLFGVTSILMYLIIIVIILIIKISGRQR